MEQRLANAWRMTLNENKFIETALLSDLRIDGRGPFDYRSVTIQFGSEDGSSEVQLGQTRVFGFVTSQLVQPYRDHPNEGTLAIFTEFSPMADPSFETGRPGESAVELGRIIDRGLRESRAVDTESLCVSAGKWVWSIRIDLHIVDNCGLGVGVLHKVYVFFYPLYTITFFFFLENRNLVDAANIAALAALLTFRRPDCTLGGEDNQEVIIHSSEVRDPIALILHHLPIAVTFAFIGKDSTVVVDPSHFEEAVMGGKLTATLNAHGDVCAIQKAGGECVMQSVIMQCLRIASVKAADITSKIKNAVDLYNTGRPLRKIKRHPDSVDISPTVWDRDDNMPKEMDKLSLEAKRRSISQIEGTEIEVYSSQKNGSSLEDKRWKTSIIGPSSWDPYSKGVNTDELKASLASRVAVTVSPIKRHVRSSIKSQPATVEESAENAGLPSSSQEPAKGGVWTQAKTLKDAVKPRHNRKIKSSSNPVGI